MFPSALCLTRLPLLLAVVLVLDRPPRTLLFATPDLLLTFCGPRLGSGMPPVAGAALRFGARVAAWLRALRAGAGAGAVVMALLALLVLLRLIGLAAHRLPAAARLRDTWERLWMR